MRRRFIFNIPNLCRPRELKAREKFATSGSDRRSCNRIARYRKLKKSSVARAIPQTRPSMQVTTPRTSVLSSWVSLATPAAVASGIWSVVCVTETTTLLLSSSPCPTLQNPTMRNIAAMTAVKTLASTNHRDDWLKRPAQDMLILYL